MPIQLALPSRKLPGLFVTGTDTGVGKTIVSCAIANWFARQRYNVGVLKPIATGCVKRREGLVSEDAEFLAAAGDVSFPLDLVCPVRLVEPLAPAVAAERAGDEIDWDAISRSMTLMSREADVMVVEGVGGVMVPLDREHSVLDLAEALALPTVIVARPGLGTLNHTLLTLSALRSRGIRIAGVVINAYPAEHPGIAEETNPRMIERCGKAPVLCLVPKAETTLRPQLTPDIHAAVEPVDWAAIAGVV